MALVSGEKIFYLDTLTLVKSIIIIYKNNDFYCPLCYSLQQLFNAAGLHT